jgi:hypothetical protein
VIPALVAISSIFDRARPTSREDTCGLFDDPLIHKRRSLKGWATRSFLRSFWLSRHSYFFYVSMLSYRGFAWIGVAIKPFITPPCVVQFGLHCTFYQTPNAPAIRIGRSTDETRPIHSSTLGYSPKTGSVPTHAHSVKCDP